MNRGDAGSGGENAAEFAVLLAAMAGLNGSFTDLIKAITIADGRAADTMN